MKLFKKCAAVLLTAMLATSLFISCGDEGGDEPGKQPETATLKGPTFTPKSDTKGKGVYIKEEDAATGIQLKTTEKGAEIYYELVKAGGTVTLSKDNYASVGTKYTARIKIENGDTIYAVVVKGSSVSDVAMAKYFVAIPEPDTDVKGLHSMIMPSGTGATIPAWGKADDAFDKNLPEVVTSFTDAADKHVALNGKTNRTDELIAAMDKANASGFFDNREVKNVIFVFSDGWGESHILGSRKYYNDGKLVLDHLPYHAPVNHDSYVKRTGSGSVTWTYDAEKNKWWYFGNTEGTSFTTTDSTAGGSAINTGFTTYYKACDVDIKGTEVKNILELAREKGMLVANVTNDYLTDATPATVGIHSPKRDDSVIINGRMFLASPDFAMGSGGYSGFVNAADPVGMMGKDDGDAAENEKTVWDASKNKYVASSEKVHGHLIQWYTANEPKLKKWAISMLNEYDGTSLTGDDYDFTNWTKDRSMIVCNTFAEAIEALTSDVKKRPLVTFSWSNSFKYNEGTLDRTTGLYECAPCCGYKLGYGKTNGEKTFLNFAEMVASTLYILDKKARDENKGRGFFAFIENTCPDGWGHANKQYDILNENQISDEGIAIAVKYVLENPDTLLVVSADHETGGVQYLSGWDTDYTKIVSLSDGDHSRQPVPVFAFGAGAKKCWGDVPAFDVTKWTPDEQAKWVKGDVYPDVATWHKAGESPAKEKLSSGADYPKILKNRTTGIRIAKAMGFEHFGDLNGNDILDTDTEYDSIVSYDKVASFGKQ